MFLIKLKFTMPRDEIMDVLKEHRKYIESFYHSDKLLLGGPFCQANGGVIVTKDISRDEVDEILKNDPLVLNHLCDFEVEEFHKVMSAKELF